GPAQLQRNGVAVLVRVIVSPCLRVLLLALGLAVVAICRVVNEKLAGHYFSPSARAMAPASVRCQIQPPGSMPRSYANGSSKSWSVTPRNSISPAFSMVSVKSSRGTDSGSQSQKAAQFALSIST